MSTFFRHQARGFVSAVFAVLVTAGFAAAPVDAAETPNLSNPNVQKVTDRVYAVIGEVGPPTPENQGFNSNSTFVITDTSVVVLDTGGSSQIGEMTIREIRKLTDKPITHVFNSHFHPDHWLGNAAYVKLKPKPRIFGHPAMVKRAAVSGENARKRMNVMTKGAHADTKIVLPNTTVNGSERFKIGGVTFVLYHPKHAHTQGDIVVYMPEEKTMVTGDVFFHPMRTPGLQHGDVKGNIAALDFMIDLDVKHVIAGHGPVTDKGGLKSMQTYLTWLLAEVRKLYEQGMTDVEVIKNIKFGEYAEMNGFKGRFPVNVNAAYKNVIAESGVNLFRQQIKSMMPKTK